MASILFSVNYTSYRVAFADSNFVGITLPRGVQTIDLVFEDTSGKSVFGVVSVGYDKDGNAPGTTDARCASYSWTSEGRRQAPKYLSVALAAGHFCSIVTT